MPQKTGIVKDERYLKHGGGYMHPESPERLEAIYAMLETPDMFGKFIEISPRPATQEEIEMIHRPAYIKVVASTAGKASCSLDPDTETSAESYEVAKLAVGGLLNAIDSTVSKETDNSFAFIRPPGHHAEADRAAGFCLFNNVAIGAVHAIKKFGMERVLIVDWDLHHGNGTQHSFYEDSRVLYFSTHQYPWYPGTGSLLEIGRGKGLGYTINVPLQPGADDDQYVAIFRRILEPVVLAFKPEIILLSAGFDIYYDDPLGGMQVTPDGFACLARILLNLADECCGGKFAVTLEGGYHLGGLTESVKRVLNEMLGVTHVSDQKLAEMDKEAGDKNPIIKRVIEQIKPIWRVF
jgi:acetoin utilization deacetylase AcuC-like enzyme